MVHGHSDTSVCGVVCRNVVRRFVSCLMAPMKATTSPSTSVMSMWSCTATVSPGDVGTVRSAAKQLQQSADTHVVPAPDVPEKSGSVRHETAGSHDRGPKGSWLRRAPLQAARTSLSTGREQRPNNFCTPWCWSYPESDYTFGVAQAKAWIEELHRPGAVDPVIHPISSTSDRRSRVSLLLRPALPADSPSLRSPQSCASACRQDSLLVA